MDLPIFSASDVEAVFDGPSGSSGMSTTPSIRENGERHCSSEYESVDAISTASAGVPLQVLCGNHVQNPTGNGEQRLRRLAEDMSNSRLRKRIIHDVAPCDSEMGARDLFAKFRRRVEENNRGTGIVAAAAHLAGNRSHLHIIHDCVWSSSSCKDVLMRGINVKNRQARFNPWTTEIGEDYFFNLINYLLRRGGKYVFIKFIFELFLSIFYCRYSLIAVRGRILNTERYLSGITDVSSQGLSGVPTGKCGLSVETGNCEIEDDTTDGIQRTNSAGESSSGFENSVSKKSRSNSSISKATLERRIEKFFDLFPCTPLTNLCKLHQWLGEEDLRYVRDNHPKYQCVIDVIANKFLSWNIRQFASYYRRPNCTPVFAMPGGCNEHVVESDTGMSVSNYYLKKEETLEWTSRLLDFQTKNKTKDFLKTLVDVLDKRLFKTNSIFVYSPTSGGKNFFFDFVLNFFLIRGQIGNIVRGERFSFMDCVDRRVIMFNEPNVSENPSTIDTLKMIFGGDLCPAAVKMKAPAVVRRTPVIILTNNPFLWKNIPEFRDRVIRFVWESAPFLKDCHGYPHPLYFPDLLEKYEVEY